jgi:hypothetical protein
MQMQPRFTPAQAARVAEVVLDALDNKVNNYREFSYDLFDAGLSAHQN